jgi:hypothetical protein
MWMCLVVESPDCPFFPTEADVKLHHLRPQPMLGELLLTPTAGKKSSIIFNLGKPNKKSPFERRFGKFH